MKLKDLEITSYPPEPTTGMLTGKISAGIKIKHIESGQVAICTESRSQHMNKRKAFKKLHAILDDMGITT
jgi:protein subunit release factor A